MGVIKLYDTDKHSIGGGNLSAESVSNQIDLSTGELNVRISSSGGSVFDGWAIYNSLKSYNGKVITKIDALAASIASVIAMAGDEVQMCKNALLMIHKPSVSTNGDANDLAKDAALLDVIQNKIAQIYMDKTGLDEATINSLINAETWLTPEQALEMGFIDKIVGNEKIENAAQVLNYAQTAPIVYQRFINKILIKEEVMNNDDLIKENTSLLKKIANLFSRKFKDEMIGTDGGAIYYNGQIGTDCEVFSDELMSLKAADGPYTANDGSSFTVSSGVITDFKDEAEPEDAAKVPVPEVDPMKPAAEMDEEITNKIKSFENKTSVLEAENKAKDLAIAELQDALKASNELLAQTEEEIKDKIKSNFSPDNSARSSKRDVKEDSSFAPKSDFAKNAVKSAMAKKK